MKRSAMVWHAAVWPAILLGSVSLAAQYRVPAQSSLAQQSFGVIAQAVQGSGPGSGPSSVVVLTAPAQTSGCPVSRRAKHLADGSMVRASRGTHPQGVGQWLHLTAANPQVKQLAGAAKQVSRALITVRGFADVPRMTEAAAGGETRADAQRTMTISFSGAAGQANAADVWVPGMTAVTSIDLKRVTYADGSVWSFAGSGSCRITPDPLMLVAAH
jgi:hypothetical protein